mgnify:CR=1 FL=1
MFGEVDALGAAELVRTGKLGARELLDLVRGLQSPR